MPHGRKDTSPRAFSVCETDAAMPGCVRCTTGWCPSRCRGAFAVWRGSALPPFFEFLAMRFRIVGSISLNMVWPATRSAAFAFDARNFVDQREQLGDIMTISSSQGNSQGDAVSIGKQMLLASQFAPIRGIWAGFFTSTGGTQGRAIDECAIPIDLVLSLEFRKQRLKDTLPKPRLSATGEGGASRCSQKENPWWPEAIATGCPFARRRECR